jgi:hypothetical protein
MVASGARDLLRRTTTRWSHWRRAGARPVRRRASGRGARVHAVVVREPRATFSVAPARRRDRAQSRRCRRVPRRRLDRHRTARHHRGCRAATRRRRGSRGAGRRLRSGKTHSVTTTSHRPLPGDHAQRRKPVVVHQHARAQHPAGAGGCRCGGRAFVVGPPRGATGLRRSLGGSAHTVVAPAGHRSLCEGRHVPATVEAMAGRHCRDAGTHAVPFRIKVHRADKRFPLASPDIERADRPARHRRVGWPVDLSRSRIRRPHRRADDRRVLLLRSRAWRGRLPVGASGRRMCLLSGGIDSPVAAWRMMRRGCRVTSCTSTAIRSSRGRRRRRRASWRSADAAPAQDAAVPRAVRRLQQQVVLAVPPPLRVVIYRR